MKIRLSTTAYLFASASSWPKTPAAAHALVLRNARPSATFLTPQRAPYLRLPSLRPQLHMASSSSATDTSIDIARNVEQVRAQMAAASGGRRVRLVAVSKTKPVAMLQQAYKEANVRVFGENYVQELVDKVPQLPNDVQWHYIGQLQSNKVNLLLRPFLTEGNSIAQLVLETVSSLKLAKKLNTALETQLGDNDNDDKLRVFVQVNTSGEASKGGVAANDDELVTLCQAIADCPRLQLLGLMTIGAPGDVACLDTLVECRDRVAQALNLEELELSMGMSGDYEVAIAKGSTNVRVGSTIFGARDYSNVNRK